MSKLSTLQMTTLRAFREANPGPVGIIVEDDQGYFPLIGYLTGEPVNDWDQLNGLNERKMVACFNGGGNGAPEEVNLREVIKSYQWCFILFQATFGRDDIALQIDQLLSEGESMDRVVLVNYHLDQSEAKDDLRRLFAMIPTVELYFSDAQHLLEIDADETTNPQGARLIARIFEHLRKAGLPPLVLSYRECRRSLESLGSQTDPASATTVVREELESLIDDLFECEPQWCDLAHEEFWSRVDSVFEQFRREEAK